MPRPEIGDCRAAAAVTLAKLAQLLPAALTATPRRIEAQPLARLAAAQQLLRVAARRDRRLRRARRRDAAAGQRGAGAARGGRGRPGGRLPAGRRQRRAVRDRDRRARRRTSRRCAGCTPSASPAICWARCAATAARSSRQALRLMGAAGHGVLLYLAHEGRGIGLINKLRAYQLQDCGLDTLDANQQLGFEPDERSYRAAAVMLRPPRHRQGAPADQQPGQGRGADARGHRRGRARAACDGAEPPQPRLSRRPRRAAPATCSTASSFGMTEELFREDAYARAARPRSRRRRRRPLPRSHRVLSDRRRPAGRSRPAAPRRRRRARGRSTRSRAPHGIAHRLAEGAHAARARHAAGRPRSTGRAATA